MIMVMKHGSGEPQKAPVDEATSRSSSSQRQQSSVASCPTQRVGNVLTNVEQYELAQVAVSKSTASPTGPLPNIRRHSSLSVGFAPQSRNSDFDSTLAAVGHETGSSQSRPHPPRATAAESVIDDCEAQPTDGCDDNAASYHETTDSIQKQLTVLDVACLILNKMIGTGIFTTPGYVLSLTNGKGLSLFLWALGGLYVVLCLIIYLDYGEALPFNGGELIYISKVWPRPTLLSAFLFSGYFLSLGHTSGNAIAFARQVILAAEPPPALPADGTRPDTPVFDSRIVNLIAISVIVLVCLLHYYTKRLGLFLNRLSALFKVLLIFLVAILAFCHPTSHIDFDWQNRSSPSFRPFDSVSGFIYIIYSYSGWENANYVIGELKAKPRTLRLGAFTALTFVTVGYVLLILAYYLACSSLDIVNGQDLGMPIILAPKFGIRGGEHGLQVCIALSALGNLIADVYTSSRVKQAIALHNFIPFAKFFAADSATFGTPGGALLLHWICSAIVIVSIPSTSDGYGFVVGLFTYGQLGIGFIMGAFYWTLKRRLNNPRKGDWNPVLRGFWPTVIAGASLSLINLMLLVAAAYPTGPGEIPRWKWALTLALAFLVSALYWQVVKRLQGRLGKKLGWQATVKGIEQVNEFQRMQSDHRRDGTELRIEWRVGDKDDHMLVRWFLEGQNLLRRLGNYMDY